MQPALTLGALVAFIQYSGFLFQPIRDISDKYNVLQGAVVASHRIFKALDTPVVITSPASPQKRGRAEGRIEFENVWFAYNDEEWVLKEISFIVEPGQSVALVGHTGSGKTTITNLLMRFYDVQKGRILLDGVDVRDWELQSLRENFAVVLQEIDDLLDGGHVGPVAGKDLVGQRQPLGRDHQADADLLAVRTLVATVAALGLRIARALAFDPALLILDEATSSIDTETEQLIQQAIARVMRNRTSVIVAHRLSTIQRADNIIVMHHGEVREQGAHQDLLALRGLYWKLYKLQYSDPSRAVEDREEEEEEQITYKPRGPSFSFSEGMG